jgi:hypothetical protein
MVLQNNKMSYLKKRKREREEMNLIKKGDAERDTSCC